ncbi:hypothetical protein ACFPRL_12170 [Pseudoclavibacter helvolus]
MTRRAALLGPASASSTSRSAAPKSRKVWARSERPRASGAPVRSASDQAHPRARQLDWSWSRRMAPTLSPARMPLATLTSTGSISPARPCKVPVSRALSRASPLSARRAHPLWSGRRGCSKAAKLATCCQAETGVAPPASSAASRSTTAAACSAASTSRRVMVAPDLDGARPQDRRRATARWS